MKAGNASSLSATRVSIVHRFLTAILRVVRRAALGFEMFGP